MDHQPQLGSTTSAANPPPVADRIQFSGFVDFLQRLDNATTVARKTSILQRYYESFCEFSASAGTSTSTGASFLPVLRLLVPGSDNERPAIGIKTKTMGKLLVRILALGDQSESARRLLQHHELPAAGAGDGGRVATAKRSDYADIVFEVVRQRVAGKGDDLSVAEVNRRLDSMANMYHDNQRSLIETELLALYTRCSAIQLKWLTRIILRRVNVGLSARTILAALHPQANDIYARSTHLSAVCAHLLLQRSNRNSADTGHRPSAASAATMLATIRPGQPFQPMLCARVRLSSLGQQLAQHSHYVETKLDGERFQLHLLADGSVRYYSRRAHDYSATFAKSLTPQLLETRAFRAVRQRAGDCILDGEMMVWDRGAEEGGRYRTKAESGDDVKALSPAHPALCPVFVAYDLLWLDGQCWTERRYEERTAELRRLMDGDGQQGRDGVLRRCEPVRLRGGDEGVDHVLECVNRALDEREEGVVLKRADARYVPGARDEGWCKVKPDYVDGLITDFDLVIVGGYLNRSKTALTKFVLAVYEPPSATTATSTCPPAAAATSGRLIACTNVAMGLTHQQYGEVNRQLKPHWRMVRHKTDPTGCVVFGLGAVPDVWIDPHSDVAAAIVLTVKGAELVPTRSMGTRFTMRFPRIVAWRPDKPWMDCCSLAEFEELCSPDHKVQKLNKRHLMRADLKADDDSKRAKKSSSNAAQSNAVRSPSKLNYSGPVDACGNICEGLEFCILGVGAICPDGTTVQQLIDLVRSHGGTVVANPTDRTFVCIAPRTDRPSLRLSTMCAQRQHNIATVDWLRSVLSADLQSGTGTARRLPPFQPADMLCTTTALQTEFDRRETIDSGPATDDILKRLSAIIRDEDNQKAHPHPPLCRSQQYELESVLWAPAKSPNYFRTATAYFERNNSDGGWDDDVPQAMFWFRWYGGRILSDDMLAADQRLVRKLSHIFVGDQFPRTEGGSFVQRHLWAATAALSAKMVSVNWVLECHRLGTKVSSQEWLVKFVD